MISSFEIKNFRCFDHLALTDLKQVNLIVGKNGAGKSALLEAIWAGESGLTAGSIFDLLRLRGEMPDEASVFGFLRELNSLRNNKSIPISAAVNDILHVIYFEHKHFSAITVKTGNADEDIETSQIADIVSDKKFDGTLWFTPNFVPQYGLTKDQLACWWDMVTLTDLEDPVEEAIRLLRPDAQRIAFIGDQKSGRVPVVKMTGVGAVPMSRLGDGITRIFGIALAIVNSKNGSLFIDEIENGLHYSAMGDLWRMVFDLSAKLNVQLFVSTHNWDCISAFAKVAKDRVDVEGQLIRLEKTGDGVRTVIYDEDMLLTAAEQGIEVR